MVLQAENVHPTADLSADAHVDPTARIWHYAQIRERATIGQDCIVGRGAYVGAGVTVGRNCKIQNYALIYEPALLEEGVFIGPAVVFTNDQFPRAVSPNGTVKSGSDWEAVGVTVREGASIGANATCVAPVEIGRWSMVGSGSVVTRDVPAFALVVGNPARKIGWVGKAGFPLVAGANPNEFICPRTQDVYELVDGELTEVN